MSNPSCSSWREEKTHGACGVSDLQVETWPASNLRLPEEIMFLELITHGRMEAIKEITRINNGAASDPKRSSSNGVAC